MVKPRNISPGTANRLMTMSEDILDVATRCRDRGWDDLADDYSLLATKLESVTENLAERIGGQTHYIAGPEYFADLKHPEKSAHGRK